MVCKVESEKSISISFAFAVIPVPPTTLKVLSEANVPPPVKPAPAIKSLAWRVSTLPSSVVNLVDIEELTEVIEPLIKVLALLPNEEAF